MNCDVPPHIILLYAQHSPFFSCSLMPFVFRDFHYRNTCIFLRGTNNKRLWPRFHIEVMTSYCIPGDVQTPYLLMPTHWHTCTVSVMPTCDANALTHLYCLCDANVWCQRTDTPLLWCQRVMPTHWHTFTVSVMPTHWNTFTVMPTHWHTSVVPTH